MNGNLFSQLLGGICRRVRGGLEKGTVRTWVESKKVQRESKKTSSGVADKILLGSLSLTIHMLIMTYRVANRIDNSWLRTTL